MKIGFYPRLAWEGIRKNRRMYFPYMLTGCVMVMMYYILRFLQDSPALGSMHGGTTLQYLLPLGCVVVAFFSALFLFYTNSFLIRQRYREFGLYNILGMDKRNIGRLMVWETLFTAAIAIGAGLVWGVALSKAAELVLLNLLGMDVNFTLHLSLSSLAQTALIYGGIYLLLLVNSLIRVRRSRPLELMRSSRVGEKRPKCNWLLAVLGIALLAGAYYLAVSIREPTAALLLFFVAVMMVIGGTYLVFISGSVAVCRLLQRSRRYYYKPNHFVSVSSMVYRMKRNGAGLASICILLTMVLVMLSSTTTLYFGEEEAILTRYPRGLSITFCFDSVDGLGDDCLDAQRSRIAPYAPEGAELSGTRYAIASGQFTDEGITLEYTHVDTVNYDRVGYLYILSLADYNRLMGTEATLEADECLIYSNRVDIPWETFTMEYGESYHVRERLTEFREDSAAVAMTVPSVYIVVADEKAFVAPVADLKNSFGYNMVDYRWFLGLDYPTAQAEINAGEALREEFNGKPGDYHWTNLYLESREQERYAFFEMYGGLFFLGIMLSIVFLMAAVLIIYYKQISEGYEDRSRFEIMRKVGMTDRDIRKSVNSQMLTVFFLPLGMAGLHLAFAFPFISRILMMFAFEDTLLNVCVTLGCFGVFALLYAVVYKITSNSYCAIVSGRRERE